MSMFFEHLHNNRHLPTYFDCVAPGNNGDQLILRGTLYAMEKAGCRVAQTKQEAEHIVLRGHGSFTDLWGPCNGLSLIREYAEHYPNREITVGPSYVAYTNQAAEEYLQDLRARVTWFARDEYSYDYLKTLSRSVNICPRLSQDAALELQGSAYIETLRDLSTNSHILVAIRKDREGGSGLLVHMKGGWLPTCVRRPLSKIRDRLVARAKQDFVEASISAYGEFSALPRVVRDVSTSVSYSEFEKLISDAGLIVTDRLHVALFGHLLGKPIVVREGVHRKVRGVYELSLSQSTNIRLVSG